MFVYFPISVISHHICLKVNDAENCSKIGAGLDLCKTAKRSSMSGSNDELLLHVRVISSPL